MTRFRPQLLLAILVALSAGAPTRAAEGAPSDPAAAAAEGEVEAAAGEDAEEEGPPRLVTAGQHLQEQLDVVRKEIRDLQREVKRAEGEDLRVIEKQLVTAKLEALRLIGRTVENYKVQEEAGSDVDVLRATIVSDLSRLGPSIVEHIQAAEDDVAKLRVERDTGDPDALLAQEQSIGRETEWADTLYSAFFDYLKWCDDIGLDVAQQREDFAARLTQRADREAGRLDLVVDEIAQIEERGDPEAKALLAGLAERKEVVSASLGGTVKLMDGMALDASEYQMRLITATGQVTTDIFKKEVALSLLDEWLAGVRDAIAAKGPVVAVKLLIFGLILGFFRVFSLLVRRVLQRAIDESRFRTSQLLQTMMVSMASNVIMGVGVLVALSQLGVELGPLLAGLGIVGFIVGFALQDSLSNFAAGVMILTYRPYDVGDTIEAAGVFGRVNHMSLVSTTIRTFDNQTLIVPNNKIWGDVIKNVTHQQQRRVDMKFRVSYAESVDRVEQVLRDVLAKHDKVLADPEPLIKVHELDESAVHFIVRPWTRTEDYWDVYWDLTRAVKERFDAEGIAMPYPQRDVHLVPAPAPPSVDPKPSG